MNWLTPISQLQKRTKEKHEGLSARALEVFRTYEQVEAMPLLALNFFQTFVCFLSFRYLN